jgi:hypothetical protein
VICRPDSSNQVPSHSLQPNAICSPDCPTDSADATCNRANSVSMIHTASITRMGHGVWSRSHRLRVAMVSRERLDSPWLPIVILPCFLYGVDVTSDKSRVVRYLVDCPHCHRRLRCMLGDLNCLPIRVRQCFHRCSLMSLTESVPISVGVLDHRLGIAQHCEPLIATFTLELKSAQLP